MGTAGLAIALLIYHGAMVFLVPASALQHYTVHLTAVLALVGLGWLADIAASDQRSSFRFAIPGLALLSAVAAGVYFTLNATALEFSQPFLSTAGYWMAALLIAAVLTLTAFAWGRILAGICAASALYFMFGDLLPGAFAGRQLDDFVVLSYLAGAGATRGINTYIPLSADTIVLLIIYGGLLKASGVIDMFAQFGHALSRLVRGGIGYSAILVSTLIGMVTGQAVSNIALSGSMTIPTMIRSGFSREESGAIECLASNGSQLVPPIMGLGAFLMAAILGIPYSEVMTAAIVPAILYVLILTIGTAALIHASPNVSAKSSDAVDWRLVLWVAPSFLLSFGVLVALLYKQYSGGAAGLAGIVVLAGLSYVRPARLRPAYRAWIPSIAMGAMTAAKLALVLAAIGILVQVFITTGMSISLTRFMIGITGMNLLVGLFLGMAICLVIGMGLPTPAAYSLIAIVVIPSLIDFGLPPLVAHFYGFYFAIYSSLTPPVAVAILTAVRISGGGFWQTALTSMKLGLTCILLPFFLVAFPSALAFPHVTVEALIGALVLLIASAALSVAMYGTFIRRLGIAQRLLLGSAGSGSVILYLVWPSFLFLVASLAALGFVYYRQARRAALAA